MSATFNTSPDLSTSGEGQQDAHSATPTITKSSGLGSWADDDEDFDIDEWLVKYSDVPAPSVSDFAPPPCTQSIEDIRTNALPAGIREPTDDATPSESAAQAAQDMVSSNQARSLHPNRERYYSPDPEMWGHHPMLPSTRTIQKAESCGPPAYPSLSKLTGYRLDYQNSWHTWKYQQRPWSNKWNSIAAEDSVYQHSALRNSEISGCPAEDEVEEENVGVSLEFESLLVGDAVFDDEDSSSNYASSRSATPFLESPKLISPVSEYEDDLAGAEYDAMSISTIGIKNAAIFALPAHDTSIAIDDEDEDEQTTENLKTQPPGNSEESSFGGHLFDKAVSAYNTSDWSPRPWGLAGILAAGLVAGIAFTRSSR
ncbi:hypothetical protein BS50DRAFT_638941 [Corynespora cassiicola Philippines]|uniref:Uncharacterized protein n=1 Tax=Corynespora cassiicola Philippines TaxID=1448308 RepID=A0A2T2N8A2_CORCC|nr:hypothetical protein BS50DRAFT_638941 [Corynespora cassiicola Philippines]